MLVDFARGFPDIQLDVSFADRLVSLVDEGFDVAVRVGNPGDSSLIARRLAPCRIVVCAAPEYLARRGTPLVPADLSRHDCVRYMYGEGGEIWHFEQAEQKVAIRVRGQLRTNHGEAMRVAVVRGRAIAALPSFIISAELAAGTLVPLLQDWRVDEMAVHAVYPPGRNPTAKLRSFIDFLVPRFGEHPSWDAWASRGGAADSRVAARAS